jgi:hypothetical protein
MLYCVGRPVDMPPHTIYLEVMTWFKGQAADFYDSGIQKLVPRLHKCLDTAGDCVEK